MVVMVDNRRHETMSPMWQDSTTKQKRVHAGRLKVQVHAMRQEVYARAKTSWVFGGDTPAGHTDVCGWHELSTHRQALGCSSSISNQLGEYKVIPIVKTTK